MTAEATYRCDCGNSMMASIDDVSWDKATTIPCNECGGEAKWEQFCSGERSGDHIFLWREKCGDEE